jgi:hypothetical protein
MKIGDLVRMKKEAGDYRGRIAGIILGFGSHHPDSSSIMISIVDVLWNTGSGWIARDRIESIKNEDR